MGVSYYSCSGCDWGYRDDSEYVCTCDCGSSFHSRDCGKLQNYCDWNEETESHRIDDYKDITCKICRKETENDYVLLRALLKHYNLTREQAFQIYKNQKE